MATTDVEATAESFAYEIDPNEVCCLQLALPYSVERTPVQAIALPVAEAPTLPTEGRVTKTQLSVGG